MPVLDSLRDRHTVTILAYGNDGTERHALFMIDETSTVEALIYTAKKVFKLEEGEAELMERRGDCLLCLPRQDRPWRRWGKLSLMRPQPVLILARASRRMMSGEMIHHCAQCQDDQAFFLGDLCGTCAQSKVRLEDAFCPPLGFQLTTRLRLSGLEDKDFKRLVLEVMGEVIRRRVQRGVYEDGSVGAKLSQLDDMQFAEFSMAVFTEQFLRLRFNLSSPSIRLQG